MNADWLLTGRGEILTYKTPKTSPFTEYPTGEESFEKNVADVAVDKVFKLRTDRLIDRQQIPNGISEENLLRFSSEIPLAMQTHNLKISNF